MKHFISLSCVKPILALLTLMPFIQSYGAGSDLKWHGYVSQGLIYTSDNSFYGDSEDVSWEFTDVALGASWRPIPRLQLSAQGIYRQAGATSRDDVYIDYALADFTVIQNMSWQLGVRGGRIKNPYGLFNDTRDVAMSRPSILLPESIYRDPIRDMFHTSDSISVYGHAYLGDHLIQLDVLHGDPIITDAVKNEFIVAPLAGNLENEEASIARILIESFGGSLRFAYTYTYINVDFQPDSGTQQVQIAPATFLTVPLYGYPGETQVEVDLWSLEYNSAHWQLNAEYQTLDYTTKDVYGPGTALKSPNLGYYVSASYRVDEQWRAFIRYDVYYSDKNDKDGKQYQQSTGRPDHNRFAYDTTFGVRYELNKNWLISMEYHRVKGTAWLPSAENNLTQAKESWDLFSAQISYKF